MRDLWTDVRHGWRALKSRPTFTIVAVLTLSLGLGATTAILSVVDAVVLAPVPYADPDDLVQIARIEDGRSFLQLAPRDVQAARSARTTLAVVGVSLFRDVAMGADGVPERLRGVVVTPETLSMLGIPPAAGRLPVDADNVAGAPCVILLSSTVSAARFGAPGDAVGRDVRIDGRPCEIIGVMPEGFAFPAPYFAPGDLWLLDAQVGIDWNAISGPGFLTFGRLAPGATLDAVRAELASKRVDVESSQQGVSLLTAMPYAAGSRDASRSRLLTLLAAALVLLLIACVNVVNLQLGRSVERQTEFATRAALGAGKGRIVRQIVAETLVLFTAAAAASLLVATWSLDLIIRLRSFFIPRMEEATVDPGTLAVCLGLALTAGLAASIFPAFRSADLAATRTHGASGRTITADARWRRVQRLLIATETALALLLTAGALLLLQNYERTSRTDPGFRTADVLHARLTPATARIESDADRAAFYERILERAGDVPGIRTVAIADVPPGVGAGATQTFAIEGTTSPGTWPRTAWRSVSAGYFDVLGIALRRGVDFDASTTGPRTAMVNEQFARQFFADGDPIGQRIRFVASPRAAQPEPDSWLIVGIVADAREEFTYSPAPPTIYVPFQSQPAMSVAILAHTATHPLELAPALQAAVAAVQPDQPVYGLRAFDYMLASELDLNRLAMTLLAMFASFAVVLAVVGVHGVISHHVGQRRNEIGIRMALGAVRRDILRLIVGENSRWAGLGVAAGILMVIPLADRLARLAPGWEGLDFFVVAATATVITLAALLASWVPARRAASLDPLRALHRN